MAPAECRVCGGAGYLATEPSPAPCRYCEGTGHETTPAPARRGGGKRPKRIDQQLDELAMRVAVLLGELADLDYDSARSASAIGHLFEARKDLKQAAIVYRRVSGELYK